MVEVSTNGVTASAMKRTARERARRFLEVPGEAAVGFIAFIVVNLDCVNCHPVPARNREPTLARLLRPDFGWLEVLAGSGDRVRRCPSPEAPGVETSGDVIGIDCENRRIRRQAQSFLAVVSNGAANRRPTARC